MNPIRNLLLAAMLLCLGAQLTHAKEWTITPEGLTLRANWEQAGGKEDVTFVVLHGTLAHNEMEIISGLQQVLADRGFSSLAVNLSLGIDARASSNYPCEHPHSHRHEDAVAELDAWVRELTDRGYTRLVIAGHSRGGNQVARYLDGNPGGQVLAGMLIAPMIGDTQPDGQEAMLLEEARETDWLEDTDLLYCQGSKVSGASYISYYSPGEEFDTLLLAERIGKPLLLFAGTDDTVVEALPGRFAALREAGKLEQVEYHLLDGADHFFRDLFLEDIGDLAEEFVAGL